MSDERAADPRAKTPGGEVGVVLQWPTSGNFRILRGFGGDVEYVNVTPVLLENGEVRLFRSELLTRVPLEE
jgi:hypothetical protein